MKETDFSDSVCSRFNLASLKTVFARSGARDAIGISHVVTPATVTKKLDAEPAFAIHIQTGSTSTGEIYVDDIPLGLLPQTPGHIRVVDMAGQPYAQICDSADFIRINITLQTLNDLAYEYGLSQTSRLQQIVNVQDPVMLGLASAMLARFGTYGADDQLFIDHIGLSFFVHIATRYGGMTARPRLSGHLSPAQLRTACEMLRVHITGDVNLEAVAASCGVSLSYFVRCFKRSTGHPPHRWLMLERVKIAKDLLRRGAMPICEIACVCGFADQSHFSRVFSNFAGLAPGRWRRQFRNSAALD